MAEIIVITDVKTAYTGIVEILKRYMVMDEKYFKISALWIIGSYFHDKFKTFPYLYFNASKGSGKTRILKLIAFLSRNGKLLGLPSEAFLYREAAIQTICLDEMENIDRKEKQDLRLLLNSAYKKGLFIPRMKKVKDEWVTEEHETYSPIALANIWGLNDVLQDRCITVILEKTIEPNITKKIEAWDEEENVLELKGYMKNFEYWENVESDVFIGNTTWLFSQITKIWNDILDNMKNATTFDDALRSLDWLSGKYKFEHTKELEEFFIGINNSKVDGRNLELYFPLIILASFVSKELYKEIIGLAEEETIERATVDVMENKDIMFISALVDFIKNGKENEFYEINAIKNDCIESIGEDVQQKDGSYRKVVPDWFNSIWIGRALRRMNLTNKKKRLPKGFQVMLNFDKIKEKARMSGIEGIEVQKTLDLKSD
jgi:hypothetical protein